MFKTLLIANRGEIACRVIRTARRLGIRTVAVYSDADADAQHVRLADEAHRIGGPAPGESYLRFDAILEVAKKTGAEAIHPGYGFLSENADFADAVAAAGIAFVGPSGASMRKMGSKAGAKELMRAHGVPVVPGYTGEDQDPARLQREADAIGYPLMIKAAHGGGGKGMRIVRAPADFAAALESCQREAKNAFGRDRVLLERYVEKPRHIEIQVFADTHGQVLHLNERECSAQRRYQKVLEESPSPFLTPALREAMGAAAVQAAKAIDYVNAGTVEFIVGQDGRFYFMEINTRLQVEHPVTELVTGLDLVELQLRVAAGEPLPFAQAEVRQQGHAIELRLYAEDPAAGFLPGSGRLERLRLPAPSAHVRLDGGVVEGDTVTIFYDPMIAKLIVWDETRPRALARLREALMDCDIRGPKSNIDFLEALVRHPSVVEGTIDTGYLDRALDEVLTPATPPPTPLLALAAAAVLLREEEATRTNAAAGPDPTSPWAIADGWRLGHGGARRLVLEAAGQRHVLNARGHGGDYAIVPDGEATTIRVEGLRLEHDGRASARIDGRSVLVRAQVDATTVLLHDGTQRWLIGRLGAYAFAGQTGAGGEGTLKAPMPGRVVLMKVAAGEVVAEGQECAVMEAMKMELSLKAPRAGTVKEVRAAAGDFVEADAALVVLE
ncbi:biotin carboxylase N-terminal domain-containing protein [Silanimonas lenta]|uniref:ATP-binding protein n=1 Tax=Silanimonas lenta TaxID=265429 RepID=UPI000412340F|nr:biotin carboxylase N-terminal domain-containing protein [Silanimonas lenta]